MRNISSWFVVLIGTFTSGALIDGQGRLGTVPDTAQTIRWVRIPPGKFQMGCVPGDSACGTNEQPRHRVAITQETWMMVTPVTVKQFRRFAATADVTLPVQPEWSRDDHPVVEITWNEAVVFCRSTEGRLPTEAEWEYAARGGLDGMLYPWGNDFEKGRVNTAGYGDDGEQTVPVGSFEPNGFGLHDVVGNVWQWVADSYDETYYARSPTSDPLGPEARRFRVARGASWKPYPKLLRVSNRGRYAAGFRSYYIGFRCIRDRPPES